MHRAFAAVLSGLCAVGLASTAAADPVSLADGAKQALLSACLPTVTSTVDWSDANPVWKAAELDRGLPLGADPKYAQLSGLPFKPVVAHREVTSGKLVVLAGGAEHMCSILVLDTNADAAKAALIAELTSADSPFKADAPEQDGAVTRRGYVWELPKGDRIIGVLSGPETDTDGTGLHLMMTLARVTGG